MHGEAALPDLADQAADLLHNHRRQISGRGLIGARRRPSASRRIAYSARMLFARTTSPQHALNRMLEFGRPNYVRNG